jgi:hypothetical protein
MTAEPTIINGKPFVQLRTKTESVGGGVRLTMFVLTPVKSRAVITSHLMESQALFEAKHNGWTILGRSND